MTAIDPTRLAAALRRQASAVAGASPASPSAAAARTGGAVARGASGPAHAAGAETVAALVARRVQSIDRDDPDRHAKAFRAFLESVLLAEFGDTLVNDAGFHRLVDDVQETMRTDGALAAQMREAAGRLLGEAAG